MVKKLRKGFTLVELLIVIIIIGILAAALLLSSSSSSDAAEAARLISDLRSLKAAALLIRAEGEEYSWSGLLARMSNPNTTFWEGRFPGLMSPDNSSIGLLININVHDLSPGVRRKLADRAASVGLYDVANFNLDPDNGPRSTPYYQGGPIIRYILVDNWPR